MYELSSYEIKQDLIKELKEYLPTLNDLFRKMKSDLAEEDDLREFYRLIETIRGASSLVKLDVISEVSSELQQMIMGIVQQKIAVNAEVLEGIDATLTFFDQFKVCKDEDRPEDIKYAATIISTLERICSQATSVHRLDPLLQLSSVDEDAEFDYVLPDDTGPASDVSDMEATHQLPSGDEPFEASLPTEVAAESADNSLSDQDAPLKSEDDWDDINWPQEELLEGFYQEAEDHFQNLGNALAQLETQITAPIDLTADHKELLRLIRRAVHTIKGAAAVIRLGDIAAWGHEFEDLLDWLYEQATRIDPSTIKVVTDAANLLEKYVSAPEEVSKDKKQELRVGFERIITDETPVEKESSVAEREASPSQAPQQLQQDHYFFEDDDDIDVTSKDPVFPVSSGKTLRVEMERIEALVNLASELIIALSGFDENMENMNSVINELDRSRLRLKGTARDLESGYELKAIRDLNLYQHTLRTDRNSVDSDLMDFDLLELDRYSEFNLLIRSLNETAVDVNTISTQLANVYRGFKSYIARLRMLFSELQEKVMRVRMTPLASIVNRLRSTVRETSANLNKNVRLAVSGEDIELDKRVWETLADPLMHLLRNAVDHGIEPPDIRESHNKPDLATIQLVAAYQGNQVVLRVIDDGAGLDLQAIRTRAKELGLTLSGKSDTEIAEVIFYQGFSTRTEVTEISGRGVGLDVVQENITALKGIVQVEQTTPGAGTTILIRIPLTLAVMRALIFEVNGRLYATALYDIQEMLRIHPRDIKQQGGRVVQIGDRTLPFYQLSERLPKSRALTTKMDTAGRMLVLVIDTGTWQAAIAIDQMHTQKEIVVKSLGAYLRDVQGVAGATIMGDGKTVPILNLEELLRSDKWQYPQLDTQRSQADGTELEILVVDDSVSVRMVISRLIQRQGWAVQTAKDGVEAVELLHQYQPDLVILDIEMPRMNGYEFMRTFRSQEKFAQTPVIMLTSRSANKHRDKAEGLGVNAFLVKPYEDITFVNLVKDLTGLNE